jgi:hypothetical protein
MNTSTLLLEYNNTIFYHCDLRKYLTSESIAYIIMALCILHILPNANCPNTCFRLHVVMRRMPRIDPSQLLTTLSVLLAPDGGIRSADDVSILYHLVIPHLFPQSSLSSVTRLAVFPSRIQGQRDHGSASNNLGSFNLKNRFLDLGIMIRIVHYGSGS